MIRAVAFDVGETLVDENRYWSEAAALAGLRPHVVLAALGATIAAGEEHTELWRHLQVERPAGLGELVYETSDLYPDVRPCLELLSDQGYRLGAAGNQSAALEGWLRSVDLPLDVIGSSAGWHVRKPSRAFFDRLVEELGLSAGEIAYVGDRVDNDVEPAAAAGLTAVHLRRGPWGRLQRPAGNGALAIDSLAELPDALLSLA